VFDQQGTFNDFELKRLTEIIEHTLRHFQLGEKGKLMLTL
jgi:hypothetical protein